MEDYLVWYKETQDSQDIVAGVCRSYDCGRELALQLAFVLRYFEEQKKIYQVGVTRVPINKVISKFREESYATRWVVVQEGKEIPED